MIVKERISWYFIFSANGYTTKNSALPLRQIKRGKNMLYFVEKFA